MVEFKILLFKNKQMIFLLCTLIVGITIFGFREKMNKPKENYHFQLITLDPGHFHAALVQKSMYSQINPIVQVYAPDGPEVKAHLSLIEGYNNRTDHPTAWKESVYIGNDYLEKMLSQKTGNVVVLAGNNLKKTTYIEKAVSAGLHVLADKPMAISSDGFEQLKSSFAIAKKKKVLLYDVMTERYEITNIIQKELIALTDIFGALEKGTLGNPAVVKESVHHFFKNVSGKPLIRSPWYYDVEQEGDGIVDVTTHLVDIVQCVCFPELELNYKTDINMLEAKRWPTMISPTQFKKSTGKQFYPDYLKKYVKDSILNVYANGEMNYTIKGAHVKISVKWNFEAPQGSGDTHFSLIRGTKANLIIRQGQEQQYKPVLYLERVKSSTSESIWKEKFKIIEAKYPGVSFKNVANGWEIVIPEIYKINHEAHFAEVMKKYLQYLTVGKLPKWEENYMLTKYYTTTSALSMANK